MSHDLRTGLVSHPSADGTTPSWRDARQWILAAAAARRVVGTLLGGPGIHDGGALTQADLTTGGTVYPACLAIVPDVAGELWCAKLPATAINFIVTATAAGAARLYLVPTLAANTTPAMAAGAAADFAFVADDVAHTAPTHGVLLGSGTITASAFTSYTAATTIPPLSKVRSATHAPTHENGGADEISVSGLAGLLADAQTPLAHKASHQNGGSDEIATATPAANAVPKADAFGRLDSWVTDASTSAKGKVQLAADGGTTSGTALQATDARLTNARTPTAHASSHAAAGSDPLSGFALLAAANILSARNTFTNGLFAMVRDTKFGPPASGTYVAGDCWIDRAGAIYYCVTGGTPGTWDQMSAGAAGTWTGASAADITTAANWNGGALLTGYRVYDSTSGEQQLYTYNGAVWLGAEFTVPMQPYAGWSASGYSATASSVFQFIMSPLHDIIVTGHQADIHGTADASNRWELDLFYLGGTSLGTLVKNSASSYWIGTPTATVLNYSTHRALYCTLTKVGTPGNCTALANNITCRYVRR